MEDPDNTQNQHGNEPADQKPDTAPDAEEALRAAEGSVRKAAHENLGDPQSAGHDTEQVLAAARDAALETQGEVARAIGGNAPLTPGVSLEALQIPDLSHTGLQNTPAELQLLSDVNLNVKIELGRTRMFVEDVLRLGEGTVVELDKLAGDPVDVYINDRHVARGEVLVLNESFCVRISEILSLDDKIASRRT